MRVAPILFSCVVLVGLVSCADDDGTTPAGDGDLEGITWILDDASARSLADLDPGDARATIRFDDGEVGGSAFCNMYGGTYETGDDGAMTIQVGAMTEMACEEPAMTLEPAFVAALGQVTGYSLGEESLVLTRGDDGSLAFTAEQPLPLVGTQWRLDGIAAGADAVSSTLAGTEVTATFADDGTLSGSGGCNRYNTSYTIGGDALTIDGGIMSTKMACEQDVMDQEAAYLAALADSATFEIQGSTLTLADTDGGFLLSFVAS